MGEGKGVSPVTILREPFAQEMLTVGASVRRGCSVTGGATFPGVKRCGKKKGFKRFLSKRVKIKFTVVIPV